MSNQVEIEKLVQELADAPDYKTASKIAEEKLKPLGNDAVQAIAKRLLTLNKPVEDITKDEWQILEYYMFALSDFKTPKSLQILLDAVLVYGLEWVALDDEISINAPLMLVELSELILKAENHSAETQSGLCVSLQHGLRDVETIPKAVIDNVLIAYRKGGYAPVGWLYSVVKCIVNETEDMRFLSPTLKLFNHEDAELRRIAVEVIGAFEDDMIIMEVTPMLEDSDESVRKQAKEVLNNAGFREE